MLGRLHGYGKKMEGKNCEVKGIKIGCTEFKLMMVS
jgi:hypothetical protein